MRPGGTVSFPRHATCALLRLEHPMPSVFAWFSLYWLETNYKKGPLSVPERRRRRNTKNMKQRLLPISGGRLQGEPVSESPPATSPPSPTSPPWSPAWEGGSSPPGLWVCGGNLVQSIYIWSLLKSMWCALHDYGTIYVVPMVDILLWDDICYVSNFLFRLYGLSYFGITPMIHAMNLSMHNASSTMSWGAWHHQV
jgi:hypothetical protein